MKIVFVILHYKVEEITQECIEYLLRQDYQNLQIIVIDNCSSNGSYEKLLQQYCNEKKVYFTSIEYNLGFAKANDLGYQIAKHRFDAECTVVINNDLMIKDRDFCKKIERISNIEKFDILGPDIINAEGVHQNPLKQCVTNKKELNKLIAITKIKLFLVPMLYVFRTRKMIKSSEQNVNMQRQENVPLHGSCLIFGKEYIDRFEFPFYPETFLYGEEDILYFWARKNRLKIVYNPELQVYHMEDISTNSILKNQRHKRVFELKNSIKSLKILKKLMDD